MPIVTQWMRSILLVFGPLIPLRVRQRSPRYFAHVATEGQSSGEKDFLWGPDTFEGGPEVQATKLRRYIDDALCVFSAEEAPARETEAPRNVETFDETNLERSRHPPTMHICSQLDKDLTHAL